jgi:hypothetical protein
MSHGGSGVSAELGLAGDAGDLDFGESAAKSFGFVMTLAALELKGDALRSAELVEDLGGHGRTINQGFAYGGAGTIIDEKDLDEANFVIHLDVEFFDIEHIALLHAVLLAAGFDDCVGHIFRSDG